MGSSLQTTIRDLGRRRGRERRGLALAEGVRLVEEAVAAGIEIRGAAASPALEATRRGQTLKSALTAAGVRLEAVSDAELAALADTEQPQGIVAVIRPRSWSLEEIPTPPGAVVLVLDAVQDPGNVGTMLRTAHGLGAAGVVALKGTADLAGPKVLRASMGASFRLPAVAAEAPALLGWLRERGAELWVADADGQPIGRERARSRPPLALAVGNEGAGVGVHIASAASRRVAVPLAPGAESLNVAIAAAILLYEVTRGD